jgi:hypothetical protein
MVNDACRPRFAAPKVQLHRVRAGHRTANAIAQICLYLVQRRYILINDARLGNFHQVERGMRVDDRKEANNVTPAVLCSEGAGDSMFEDCVGMHKFVLVVIAHTQ